MLKNEQKKNPQKNVRHLWPLYGCPSERLFVTATGQFGCNRTRNLRVDLEKWASKVHWVACKWIEMAWKWMDWKWIWCETLERGDLESELDVVCSFQWLESNKSVQVFEMSTGTVDYCQYTIWHKATAFCSPPDAVKGARPLKEFSGLIGFAISFAIIWTA